MQTAKSNTDVASEAEPLASNGGAHNEQKPCSPAAEPDGERAREDSSVSAQRSVSPAECPDEAPRQPTLASESNGEDQSLGAHLRESKLADSGGVAGEESSQQRAAYSSREKEKGEEDSFRFTKGAYFIGKCVWGKVSLREPLSISLQCPGMSCPCLPSPISRWAGGLALSQQHCLHAAPR